MPKPTRGAIYLRVSKDDDSQETDNQLISDRTKAGLERARRSGKLLGRPDGFKHWAPVLASMKEREFSQGRMARETGLSYNTVKKYLGRLEGPRDDQG